MDYFIVYFLGTITEKQINKNTKNEIYKTH